MKQDSFQPPIDLLDLRTTTPTQSRLVPRRVSAWPPPAGSSRQQRPCFCETRLGRLPLRHAGPSSALHRLIAHGISPDTGRPSLPDSPPRDGGSLRAVRMLCPEAGFGRLTRLSNWSMGSARLRISSLLVCTDQIVMSVSCEEGGLLLTIRDQ